MLSLTVPVYGLRRICPSPRPGFTRPTLTSNPLPRPALVAGSQERPSKLAFLQSCCLQPGAPTRSCAAAQCPTTHGPMVGEPRLADWLSAVGTTPPSLPTP